MLDFIPAKIRKRIYETLAAINGAIPLILSILAIAGIVPPLSPEQIVSLSAQFMTVAGFLLAAKNVDIPSGRHVADARIEGESSSN